MTVIVPCDAIEARKATVEAARTPGPVYLRLGRSGVPVVTKADDFFKVGKANTLKEGKDISIFACGQMVSEAIWASDALAKEGINSDRVREIYGAAEIYAQDYYLSLLDEADWQQLGGGNEKLISEDAELIYQHKINGTDARYAGDLKSVLGEAKYQFYVKQIERIIADKIEPLVARPGVYSSPVALLSKRPQVNLPMPESLTFGQVPGIAVSSQDSALALYLSNPQDSALADTAHPIDYEGIRHESIQHAFGTIAQTIPQSAERNKQLYALTKNLLIAKFTQFPEMRQQVEENGGLKWLKSCRCDGEGFWAGAGEESALVRLIIQAQTLALKSQVEIKFANKNLDPIAQAKSDYPPISRGTNLSSYSQDSLGAALSLTTNLALYKKTITEAYSVSFRGNPYRKFDLTHKAEKYRRDKQQGVPFESAFDAYRHFGKGLNDNAQKESLLTEILQARFEQHPQLAEAIALRGGVSWLEKCEVKLFGEEPYLEGKGKSSGFIRATAAAYEAVVNKGLVKSQAVVSAVESLVVEESEYEANLDADLGYISEEDDKELMDYIQQKLKSIEAPEAVVSNPIASVVPSNSAVAKNMEKDIAMGAVATQFIGTPVRYDGKSSTEKYQQAWGDKANTGKYSPQDIVMVSGNGNWRGVQLTEIEAVFNGVYAPLLDKAIAAKAQIVVGSAQGTDRLVQEYLKNKGYQLSDSGEGYMKATAGDLIAGAETLKPSPSVNRNQSTELLSPELKISGKPMQMNFPLKTYSANSLPVDNCFDAMRGHGRTHTTRNFEPHQAYGVREGDIMLAYKGAKDNPQAQIALRVGKQSEITPAMMKDKKFQHFWSNKEKHAPQALPEFFSKEITDGKSVWGLDFEPLGDYRDGKIYDFATGSEVDIS
ncbi:MAG: hypothetical protein RLZZ69_3651, partial [Cyanobacteriota bacterium]